MTRLGYDVVVVGAGSAGCVVAARLSEDESCRVLLVEAGPDYQTARDLPTDIADASQPTTSHDWGYASEVDDLGRSVPLPRGRLVGGCSATNAAFMLRGWPADNDAWAEKGNLEWSFTDLLPTFLAVEADADCDDDWHGGAGPIPVSRPSLEELSPLQRAFLDTAVGAGHARVEDYNRPGAIGVGPLPRNVRGGIRMSTALTHLAPARSRPNLTIRSESVVDTVMLSGTRAGGIRLADAELIEADRVVLAAGAYASPVILLRSGVGPPGHLHNADVDVVIDLAGVGENLSDHPSVAVDLPTGPGFEGPRFQALLTMRSSLAAPDGPPDLHLFPAGPFDDAASPSGAGFGIVTGLLAPRSRGTVRLRSRHPLDPPRIDIAHLRHVDDVARMVEATQAARRLSRTSPLADLVLGPELAPGPDVADDDVAALAASIRSRVGSYHHPVGTCAMGSESRPGAVVDPRGRVHGADALWVADASVMPDIPSANPNLSTIAIADRIAGWIAQG